MTRAASPLTQHVSAAPLSSVLFLHNETKGRLWRREEGAAAVAAQKKSASVFASLAAS